MPFQAPEELLPPSIKQVSPLWQSRVLQVSPPWQSRVLTPPKRACWLLALPLQVCLVRWSRASPSNLLGGSVEVGAWWEFVLWMREDS